MFFLATRTGFAYQVAILISRMKFAANSQVISSPIALRLGSEYRRMACCTGLASLKTSSECSANSLGTPGMSAGTHAKIFQLSRRNSTSALTYATGKLLDTSTVLLGSVGWT